MRKICLLIFLVGSSAFAETWTLEKAIRFALENNPQAHIARERINAAEAYVRQAKSAYLPQVDLLANYVQTDNPMTAFGMILGQQAFNNTINFNSPGHTDNLNLTGSISYRLYNGGRDIAGLNAAQSQREAAEFIEKATQNELAFAVVNAWYNLLQATEVLTAHKAAVASFSESLKVAEARFKAGNYLKTEVLNLQVQLAQAKENLVSAKHGVALSQKALLNVLGLKGESLDLQDTKPQIPLEILSEDYHQRPELLAQKKQVEAARLALEVEKGSKKPTADLFAKYQYDKGWKRDGDGDSWTAGVQFSYNLFDGHRSNAGIVRKQAEYRQAEARLRQLELQIDLEVSQAKLQLEQARETLDVTATIVEQAEESARLNRARFEKGVILSSELIDIETRLTQARMHRSIAKANECIALASLRKALGKNQIN